MNQENFTQGMSHEDGLENNQASENLVNYYNGLKDRPDYDGIVNIIESNEFARTGTGDL